MSEQIPPLSPHLMKAFWKRDGRTDHESFMFIVEAFYQELREDNLLIIPMQTEKKKNGQAQPQPLVVDVGKDLTALVMVTEPKMMLDLPIQSYGGVPASNVIQFLRGTPSLDGILINPLSESHCFMPRDDIFGYMKAIGLDL